MLEVVSRGVYRLASLPALVDPDLVTVAVRVPRSVVCLISSLHFHGLTSEIPREVSIALPRGTTRPRLSWPPLHVYWFAPAHFEHGIEKHERDGVELRVYGPARTIADCFRFRNRLGIQVAVDGLRTGLSEQRFTPAEIMDEAKLLRVGGVIRPYLEAMQ